MLQSTKVDKIFKAIADPTRRQIFHVLVVAASAIPISQIAQDFDISRQGVTKHIKTLESAGLVTITKSGRERYCKPNMQPLKEVRNWLNFYEQFWDTSMDKLGDFLDGQKDV